MPMIRESRPRVLKAERSSEKIMENYTTLKTQVKQVVAKFEDVTNSKKYTYHHRPPRALELVTHSLPWNILK